MNVAFWADKESAATVLAAEHSAQAPRSTHRSQSEHWQHVLHVVAGEAVPGKDRSVVDMAWYVHGHPMTLWLAVAWTGGQVGVVDFSRGPETAVWLWEQQVTVEAISACFHVS